MKRLLTTCVVTALVILAPGTAVAGEITAGDFPDRSEGLLTWMNVEGFEDRVIGTHTLSGFDLIIDGTYDGVPIVGGEHKVDMYHWAIGWMPGTWQPGFATSDTYTTTAPEDIPGENSLVKNVFVTQTHGESDVYQIEVQIDFMNGIKQRYTNRVTLPGVESYGSADLLTTTDGLGYLWLKRHRMASPEEHYCGQNLPNPYGAGESHGWLSGDLTAYSKFVLVLPYSSRFITDSQGFRVEALTIPPPKQVEIDIKPGSDPNSINPNAGGVIPVAILTTADFDASTVDPETVALDGAGARGKGKSGKYGSMEDVDGDGDLDLVVQIENVITWAPDATEATLTGQTYDGIAIQGTDTVNIVPPE